MKTLVTIFFAALIFAVQCTDYDDKEESEEATPVKIDGKVYGHNIRVDEKLYYVSLQPAPWQEALYFCRSKGQGLVDITDNEELTKLGTAMSEHRLDGWAYWTRHGDDVTCGTVNFPRPYGAATQASIPCGTKSRYICEPLV